MKPIQFFLPVLNGTITEQARRLDMERIFQAWKGESTIWLLPWLEKTARWIEPGHGPMLAIPSQTIEKVYAYHIGANGYAFGPLARERFPEGRVDSLRTAWLNYQKHAEVKQTPPPERPAVRHP